MPFTIDGQWVPAKSPQPKKPVKVSVLRRGNNTVTAIQNLDLNETELTTFASKLKKKLGCGGAIKDGMIEIQGDKIAQVKMYLKELGI